MSFRELTNLKLSYESNLDNIVESFYIPVLTKSKVYKRAVGFFSSNILLQISRGLGSFIDNGGKMKLLVSTQLSKEDYMAIEKGYEIRELVENRINESLNFDIEEFQNKERFEMLAYMVSKGLLEIKVVFLENNNDNAMFHQKNAVLFDENNNMISFTGSVNETYNAFYLNSESIDVFYSWHSEDSEIRCYEKNHSFDAIWDNKAKGLCVIPFPEVSKNKLLKFTPSNVPDGGFTSVDKKFIAYVNKKKNEHKKELSTPKLPEKGLRGYQEDAIKQWVSNDFSGIFDMATGTGKTFTGGGAIYELFKIKKRAFVIVVCPYTHLVDQWCEELKNFRIDALKCYGSTNYKSFLSRDIKKFEQKRTNFVCAVVTNASFMSESFQLLISSMKKEIFILVDEAHNFGADHLSDTLSDEYPYRLALSATIDRHGDPEGTKRLYDFFGKKCIEYTLQKAIQDGFLTPYKYHPILVSLTADEYEEYVSLSKKIGKHVNSSGVLSDTAKSLLIKRARLIAGAENKLVALKNILLEHLNDTNMLIYCGAVKYGQFDYDKCEEEKKQIEKVLKMLNCDLKITSAKFTSDENSEERHNIVESFKEEDIQALVAIKCLDEGVNIPSIKTAFILASSTNPKEYVQRRGRVLRQCDGKPFAEIYDFITIPSEISSYYVADSDNLKIEKGLVKRELIRMNDFANLSLNPTESNNVRQIIKDNYGLDYISDEEDIYD